ncbi:DUF2971 domain-containing protein [Acidocella sp.]|uniref:DUF2971 domain-containing protein n=1 Tax=Acidocella sp. TaxID=50710 RepID=UPI0018374C84|nr:DUF2971 domain-containing protein [Acidocella sp.]NNM56240.1 DUF2971 domain-containing protein [Acidocella sp.]
MATSPPNVPGSGYLNAEWWPIRVGEENANGTAELSPLVKQFVKKYVLRFPEENKLFHYTTISGLFGIIEANDIYVSHVRYLNDISEVTHGQELAANALRKMATKPRFGGFSKILEHAAGLILKNVVKDYFVASFSRVGNDLTQWRSYGKESGVCIEFDLSAPHSFVHFHAGSLARAVYRSGDKLRLTLFWVQRYLAEYRAELNRSHSLPDWAHEAYAKSLTRKLEYEFSRFKHDCFSSEQEIRLIISGDEPIHRPRRYRTSGRFIIPYYHASDTTLREDGTICIDGTVIECPKLPVASVTVGPMQNQSLCAQSVQEFLAARGYNPNVVRTSELPYQSY